VRLPPSPYYHAVQLPPSPYSAYILDTDLDVVQACGTTTIIIAATHMSVLEDSMKTSCEKMTEGTECLGELSAHSRARARVII
jgi:hypothetical protein